jgi:hypothetical protein
MKRRTLLTTGASIATLALASAPAAAQRQTTRNRTSPEAFVKPGVNQFDVDDDGDTDVDVVPAPDPSGGEGRVAHGTSNGTKTNDYVTTVRPVEATLGTFADGGTLTYEYYEGPKNTHAAPDEVWLHIEDTDGNSRVLWHAANDDLSSEKIPDNETWLTRNVHREITGTPDAEDNPSYNWFEMTNSGRTRLTGKTGDNNTANLVEVFGEDAELRHVGVGIGQTNMMKAASDVYYRDLKLDGESEGPFAVNGGTLESTDRSSTDQSSNGRSSDDRSADDRPSSRGSRPR